VASVNLIISFHGFVSEKSICTKRSEASVFVMNLKCYILFKHHSVFFPLMLQFWMLFFFFFFPPPRRRQIWNLCKTSYKILPSRRNSIWSFSRCCKSRFRLWNPGKLGVNFYFNHDLCLHVHFTSMYEYRLLYSLHNLWHSYCYCIYSSIFQLM
jgi:hypothetical protein